MKESVCFIGHRKIKNTPELREYLFRLLSEMAENGTVNFLFGDHSEFNDLCYETVTKLKEKYPAIQRIHFRKDYEDADDYTMKFLISGYEQSICPKGVARAGKSCYAQRNQAMIRQSDICVFYFDENYRPPRRKNSRGDVSDSRSESGTALAFRYAEKMKKTVINCFLLEKGYDYKLL